MDPQTTVVHIVAWPDPIVDQLGHDARSPYVERFWLGIVGPSSVLFLRQAVDRLEREPEGFVADVATTARSLGLGAGTGRQGPLGRTISRCCLFGLAQRFGHDGVAVRRRLPPLARHQLARLPDDLQAEHVRWSACPPRDEATSDPRFVQARRLAETLLDVGEPPAAILRQLHSWHYPPPVAARALNAAQGRRAAHEEGMLPLEWAGDAA